MDPALDPLRLLPRVGLVADRLVTIIEVVSYSFCLGLLALDTRLRDIRVPGACLLISIALIDSLLRNSMAMSLKMIARIAVIA